MIFDLDPIVAVSLTAVVGLTTIFIYVNFMKRPRAIEVQEKEPEYEDAKNNKHQKGKQKQANSKSSKTRSEKQSPKGDFSHPWLVTTLKGHSDQVTSFDISPNGKYMVSCGTDRSLFLWTMKQLTEKDHRSVRANVEYDSARLVKFSPDSKSFITCLETGNRIRVFKFSKNDDGTIGKVQQALEDYPVTHKELIMRIGIDTAGNYIMTADTTTKIDILSIKGEKLHSIDTGTMKNSDAGLSPCGRFVAVSGFTPDVRVWEVQFDKTREFRGVKRAFELKGHSAGIVALAFSADSSRMATVSKDSTWKLWKTDVEYHRGQDPYLLKSGPISGITDQANIRAALSHDGRALAISITSNIHIINCVEGILEDTVNDVYKGDIRHIMFSNDGKYLFCCGERNIKAFHNVVGYKAKISDYTQQLATCTKAMERRLQEQLNEARLALDELQLS